MSLARDYVEGMWRILQQDSPDDFVLATGETHSVREFVERSFALMNMEIQYVELVSIVCSRLINCIALQMEKYGRRRGGY